jgi:hypothetical protein
MTSHIAGVGKTLSQVPQNHDTYLRDWDNNPASLSKLQTHVMGMAGFSSEPFKTARGMTGYSNEPHYTIWRSEFCRLDSDIRYCILT